MSSYSCHPCALVFLLSALFCSLVMSQIPEVSQRISLPGCPSTCGNLTIPYPFGIGTECARKGFDLSCNHSFNPPKTFISTSIVDVLSLSLLPAQARANYFRAYDCYSKDGSYDDYNNPWAGAGDDLPYTFSNLDNKFVVVGCDTYAYISGYNATGFKSGCISSCSNLEQIDNSSCSGLGCCQVSIPKGLKYYEILVFSYENHTKVWDFNPCGYAFLVDQAWFTFRTADITNNSIYRYDLENLPVVMDWVVGNESCEVASKDRDTFACRDEHSECFEANSSATGGYLCRCSSGYEGNPYLVGGCQDIDECNRHETYTCNGDCVNFPGGYNCTCPKGTSGDPKTYGCINNRKTSRIILGTIIPCLVGTFLVICLYGLFERRKRAQLAQKFYEQNGGTILEQHMSTHTHIRSLLKIFNKEELEKATNKFDDSKLLGRGGQGMVYEGNLSDNSKIAIKKSVIFGGVRINDFINEIIILSQINHRNVVRLLGCCLEVEIPYLVYEFVPNNTLFYHIHNQALDWRTRLRIAADTATALAYLHTKAAIPIYHQDVKSTNILLDNDYTAKVSDFGASKLILEDKEALNTLVQGTMGYLDPEYLQTHELTDKSDVYSFGVVLVELLTGREPLSYHRSEKERCLAQHFNICMEESKLIDILDPRILVVSTTIIMDQMTEVAKLAVRCLNLKGKKRPCMMDVSLVLEGLWSFGDHQQVETHASDETEYLLSKQRLNGQGNIHSTYFSSDTAAHDIATFAIDGGR